MREAWVMCGGPSHAYKIATPKGDCVIAVNKDVFRYTEADYFITMDNRFYIWEIENKVIPLSPTKVFVANMADKNMRCDKTIVDKRWGVSYTLAPYDMIIKSYSSSGFGKTFKTFSNGGNSGYCAIQLAIILGFKVIHVVGMDLCVVNNQTHHHGGYNKCLDDYPRRFDEFFNLISSDILNVDGVKFINHSPVSRLKEVIGYEPLP